MLEVTTGSQQSFQNKPLVSGKEQEVTQPAKPLMQKAVMPILVMMETGLQRVHKSVNNALMRRGVRAVPTVLIHPLEDMSYPFRAMPILAPNTVGATQNKNLEVHLKALMSALNSVSASSTIIAGMVLEGDSTGEETSRLQQELLESKQSYNKAEEKSLKLEEKLEEVEVANKNLQ